MVSCHFEPWTTQKNSQDNINIVVIPREVSSKLHPEYKKEIVDPGPETSKVLKCNIYYDYFN